MYMYLTNFLHIKLKNLDTQNLFTFHDLYKPEILDNAIKLNKVVLSIINCGNIFSSELGNFYKLFPIYLLAYEILCYILKERINIYNCMLL